MCLQYPRFGGKVLLVFTRGKIVKSLRKIGHFVKLKSETNGRKGEILETGLGFSPGRIALND